MREWQQLRQAVPFPMYFTEKCRGQLQPANNMVWYVYHLQWILYVACTRLKLEQLKRLGAAVGCHRGSDEMMATRQLFQLDRSQSLFYFVPQDLTVKLARLLPAPFSDLNAWKCCPEIGRRPDNDFAEATVD